MIRVSILADSPVRAKAIADLLAEEDQIEVLIARPDVIFADVVIAAGASTDDLPLQSNVVFLTGDEPVSFEPRGKAWLPTNATAGELIAAVFAAAQDLTVLTNEQARRRLPGRNSAAYGEEEFLEHLTQRELQVLRMLANGLGNKEIATQLGISDHTAKFHVAQILAKLRAGSRTEAVTIAIRRGLVPI